MPHLPADVKRWLDSALATATVATVGLDGHAHLMRAAVLGEGDDILIAVREGSGMHHNLIYDPRATVLISDPDDPARWVEVRGEVEMTTGGAVELAATLGFPSAAPVDDPDVLVVRVVAVSVVRSD